MTKELFAQAVTKYILGLILVGLLVFLPAGTLSFFIEGYSYKKSRS